MALTEVRCAYYCVFHGVSPAFKHRKSTYLAFLNQQKWEFSIRLIVYVCPCWDCSCMDPFSSTCVLGYKIKQWFILFGRSNFISFGNLIRNLNFNSYFFLPYQYQFYLITWVFTFFSNSYLCSLPLLRRKNTGFITTSSFFHRIKKIPNASHNTKILQIDFLHLFLM